LDGKVKPGLSSHILRPALFLPGATWVLLSTVSAFILPVTAVQIPEWCKALPRPEYKTLERVELNDAWFEVYKVAADTYAIYEPHQSEETIAYLILGKQNAILFDTGMGISDIHRIIEELTKLPVIVLNSHTHDDHVGGNWQFKTIYSMDTKFTRENAKGSVEDAQAEIAPGEICGDLPNGFEPNAYRTRPWKIAKYLSDGEKIDLGGRVIQVLATPGHTPDAITLYDRANGLLFTGDTYYPATIWLYRPETNFDQYARSVEQLAVLAPSIKLVLGAHNVPVAPPTVLSGLAHAFTDLRAGKAECKPDKPGRQVCTVRNFSFLVRAH
jgi:glyoxylase-like metal-dependent hydrolase (beta-lactamase superfamily II)